MNIVKHLQKTVLEFYAWVLQWHLVEKPNQLMIKGLSRNWKWFSITDWWVCYNCDSPWCANVAAVGFWGCFFFTNLQGCRALKRLFKIHGILSCTIFLQMRSHTHIMMSLHFFADGSLQIKVFICRLLRKLGYLQWVWECWHTSVVSTDNYKVKLNTCTVFLFVY